MLFKTTGLKLKLLILIVSPNIFHWKSAKKIKWVWSWGKIWIKLGPSNSVKKVKKLALSVSLFSIFRMGNSF